MPTLKTKCVTALIALGAATSLALSAHAQEVQYPETADPEMSSAASEQSSDMSDTAVPDTLASGLTLTKADGTSMALSFSDDASFTTNDGVAGSWSYEDGYLCLTGLGETSQCTLMPDDAAAGASWSVTTASGGEIIFALPEVDTATDGEDSDAKETTY